MTDHVKTGRAVLETEIKALNTLSETLGDDFEAAVSQLQNLKGRIILTGVGKSGHVARKISATLASTGSPSLYIHPTEASHGDMGMIREDDAVIALSRSGETKELADIIGYCRRFGIPLYAMTASVDSTLGKAANYLLLLPDAPEACAETRAPTTSTTLQIALGDALSVALLEAKGFTAKDFKAYHPGGALGTSLATVADLMHTDDALPLIGQNETIDAALKTLGDKGFGCVGILDGKTLIGIITDGDLRRNYAKVSQASLADIMTKAPKTAAADDLAADALRKMSGGKITQLFVVRNGQPVGIVHLHDFLKAGIA